MRYYRSSIPKAAGERIVATFLDGPQKYKSRLTLNGELRGIRFFHETGELETERPLKNGKLHGVVYRSDEPGKLTSAEPYRNGLPHGTAKQWSDDGKLMGSYTMKHGTGIDLWWQEHGGFVHLNEARYVRDGKWHGFEWWLAEGRLFQERHFWNDELHGVERRWNSRGALHRGYPKYWIQNRGVNKRQYLRASASDPSLPPFRERDNRLRRSFPPEVAAHLARRAL
jgi:hypothetical protein